MGRYSDVAVDGATLLTLWSASLPLAAAGVWDQECVRSAVVVFKHGSVVFFNVDEAVQTKYLHSIMRHCGGW